MNSVAICIPTYNQSAYLVVAVESAFAQTYPQVEVWVSDDCSTDDTTQTLKSLHERYPTLRYHRQEHNLGMGANTNWVVSQPTTEFIVRLDSDDVLHPQYVEKLVALLTAYPKAGYAHCAVREINEMGQVRRVRRLAHRSQYQTAEESLRASVMGFRVSANICLFRARTLRELKFYSTKLGYSHDWDLAVRIADAGWGNTYEAEILASYRVWEDTGKVRPKRKQAELQDCIQIFETSLAPAFTKRGWTVEPLWKSRRSMALTHAIVLDAGVFLPQERAALIALLQRLGASPALRWRLALIRLRLGFLLRWQYHLNIMVRDRAKQILALLRPRGAARGKHG